jgi:hypothetical protein
MPIHQPLSRGEITRHNIALVLVGPSRGGITFPPGYG